MLFYWKLNCLQFQESRNNASVLFGRILKRATSVLYRMYHEFIFVAHHKQISKF